MSSASETKKPVPRGFAQSVFNRQTLQQMGVFISLILLCVVFSVLAPDRFPKLSNFWTVSRQVSFAYIAGVGMTFIMITANIDLAVGSYLALTSIFAAWLLGHGTNWFLTVILTMAALAAVQGIVGLIVAKQRLSAFIVTLAMMSIARGIALAWTSGIPIPITDQSFIQLGTGWVLTGLRDYHTAIRGIPVPVVVAFIVLIIGQFILKKTKFGRYVYAIGGNEQAAVTSGINVAWVKVRVFMIAGALMALAGCIMGARLYSGNPTTGIGFEMDVIAGVVIGGTSMTGGVGGMVGTLIGAFTVGVIANGLTILGVDYAYQQIVKGVIIYVAVLIDVKTKG
ncbi:MAG: ABC transporter permease [Planctomycetes bacterium]|nr:ABC transporter permease [Planctomycetota bacterium]